MERDGVIGGEASHRRPWLAGEFRREALRLFHGVDIVASLESSGV